MKTLDQDFKKLLDSYKTESNGKVIYDTLQMAYDVFFCLNNLNASFNHLKDKEAKTFKAFEALQRAIHLHVIGATSINELSQALTQASIGINIHKGSKSDEY